MKIKGIPEEMKEAKAWWAEQKKKRDNEYKEAKKKDPKAKKDFSLVSPENKERNYHRHEVNFSQIKGNKSQGYLDNYIANHGSEDDYKQKQIEDDFESQVLYRTIYRFEGEDRQILLFYMQGTKQVDIARDLGISASAVNQRLKVLLEDYRILLCNDKDFKKTQRAKMLRWESKTAYKKYIEEIRQSGKFIIDLNKVQDLIKEVKKIIKKTISTGADVNIKQKLSKQIDFSHLDDKYIEQMNKAFADYGIEADFNKVKNFKGNVMQVLKMVDDFINELQKKTLK